MSREDKKVSLLLDAIAAETEAQARQEARARTRSLAEAATPAPPAPEEAPDLDEEDDSVDEDGPRRPPPWLGRSAAELLAGRGGRVGSTTDVHTGGAREIEAPPPKRQARIETTLDVHGPTVDEDETPLGGWPCPPET